MRIIAACLVTLIATVVGRPGAFLAQCVGDCSGDLRVTVNELVVGVNIALGTADLSARKSLDVNAYGVHHDRG